MNGVRLCLAVCFLFAFVKVNYGAFSAKNVASTLAGRLKTALRPRKVSKVVTLPDGRSVTRTITVDEPHDIFYVVDRSGSIGSSNFETIRKFMKTLIEGLIIGDVYHHAAIVTFAYDAKLNADYVNHPKSHCHFIQEINQLPYTGGATNTKDGFLKLKNIIEDSLESRSQGKKIVFYITDGNYNRGGNPHNAIQQVKNIGGNDQVIIFSFGIGNVQEQHLRDASSNGYFQSIPDFANFGKVVSSLRTALRVKGVTSNLAKGRGSTGSTGGLELPVPGHNCHSSCTQCVCKTHTGSFYCKPSDNVWGSIRHHIRPDSHGLISRPIRPLPFQKGGALRSHTF